MGADQVFSEHSEPVKRELRAYIECSEKFSTKKDDQISLTIFLAKYGGLSLYDIDTEKGFPIDHKEIYFLKGDGYALIGNPDHPDGSSTDHEYFCIHDDLFDRILETDQDSDITLKVIHKETSLSSINVKISNSIPECHLGISPLSPHHLFYSCHLFYHLPLSHPQ